ncbi:hypothetical protein GWI33_012501 [Rhynchophorus ferrugineus]|uniref:Uncharacterized protein n=1 Tax=Rhynchophorus ferrugineus TaxID=354439 RepID=A0A834MCF1_RHYFE|nr:hypothetical protein GWI33_012501 [Rhynchophorus ferrugineus]
MMDRTIVPVRPTGPVPEGIKKSLKMKGNVSKVSSKSLNPRKIVAVLKVGERSVAPSQNAAVTDEGGGAVRGDGPAMSEREKRREGVDECCVALVAS